MSEHHAPAPSLGSETPPGAEVRRRLLAAIPAGEHRWDLAGVRTAVLDGGEGPPVVILHGGGQFAATWSQVIPQLVARHRVVVPDLPGHGASQVLDGVLDADRVLSWLGELLDAICPSPPALVGHTAGGAIAARFASAHSDRISSLVLVDSLGLAPFRPASWFALAKVAFLVQPTEHTRDRFLKQRMPGLERVSSDMGEAWDLIAACALEAARTPRVRSAGRSLMKAFGMSAIPEADLVRIAVPTTLVWGRDDVQVRPQVAEEASARHGWRLRIIDDCGVDPNLEQPNALLDMLRDALNRA